MEIIGIYDLEIIGIYDLEIIGIYDFVLVLGSMDFYFLKLVIGLNWDGKINYCNNSIKGIMISSENLHVLFNILFLF